MSFHHSPKIVTDGLVFYVNPSDPKCYSGGSTCRDLTRINGNGILNNVTLSSDKAFQMNSSTSRVYFTRSFANVTNSTTYITTVEIPSSSNYAPFFSSINENFGGILIYILNENSISAIISEDSGSAADELITNIPNNYPQKIVIAFTLNGTVFKLYINGVLISARSPHVAGNVNSQSLIELGYTSLVPAPILINTKFYNSLIYNRPLNDNEILQNFNALKGRFNL